MATTKNRKGASDAVVDGAAVDTILEATCIYWGERFLISLSSTTGPDCHGAVARVPVDDLTTSPWRGEKKTVASCRVL